MNTIIQWLIYALAIVISAYILPGVHIASFVTALVLAVVLSIINLFVRPLLVVLTLPVTIFTLGLFLFILNALLIMFAAYIVPGFVVASFWWALLFAIVLSLVRGVLDSFAHKE